jgi:hypothetical protein
MSKTTTELATAVLQHMGVLDATETPDTDDETYVTGVYEDKWAEMSSHGHETTYWPRDTIPDAVFLTLRDLIALHCRAAFGEQMSAQQVEAEETIIMRRLRKHIGVQSSGRHVPVSYM